MDGFHKIRWVKMVSVGAIVIVFTILAVQILPVQNLPFSKRSGFEVSAQPIPPGTVNIEEDIRKTRHNLSAQGLGDVKATSESEVCVFCHTPHGASGTGVTFEAPIWNRNVDYQATQGYILYDNTWSYSFEGVLEDPTKPTGFSRLCLSCHDGVIALGSVINKGGSGGFMSPTPIDGLATGMPPESGPGGGLGGDTRLLGTNLQNDHPISFVFDSTLATADTELKDPGGALPPADFNATTVLAPAGAYKTGVKRYPGNTPGTINQVQCTSCHNPHAVTYPKFLRAPRLQDVGEKEFLPAGLPTTDHPPGQIICLYCHEKPGWIGSTHDRSNAIREAYPAKDDPGTSHPENFDFDGVHTVGQVACRNCHDPHTAQGAERLHREGVDTFGGSDAIENTCYLCHSPDTQKTQNVSPITLPAGDPTGDVGTPTRFLTTGARIAPDIISQFGKDTSNCLGGNSTGSAMCLQLPTLLAGHEPVFVARSQEGIQLKSDGVLLTPPLNEETPGMTTPDERHVECVDCHNPHQVNSPNFASVANNAGDPPNEKGGRFKGMKGIGIDVSGTRPIVVGRFPGIIETDIDGNSAFRDPYVYEICFRCHGNSYERIFEPYRYPDDQLPISIPVNFASRVTDWFSPRSDPQAHGSLANELSLKGFSNKWLEFNPKSPVYDRPVLIANDLPRFGEHVPSHPIQPMNAAYHPVVAPGRNRSPQLCKQLSGAFGLTGCQTGAGVMADQGSALAALNSLTIQCTDCHNNDYYDAFENNESAVTPIFPGRLGPLTESNLRPTDKDPGPGGLNRDVSSAANYNTTRVTQPIGPHGSQHIRLLRANYGTDILASTRCFEAGNPQGCPDGDGYTSPSGGHSIAGGGQGSNDNHYKNFLLCFQCHDRAAFDPDVTTTYYGGTTLGDQDRSLTRFFGTRDTGTVDSWWEGNLHMYHLRWSGAMCHECHYNVHSNIEALNTIYGDGTGAKLPPDGQDDGSGVPDGVINTHLINFGPTVEGTTERKPVWFYEDSTQSFRCYLRCHNEVMDSCAYQAPSSGTPNARWCAGGRNPGTSG